MDAAALFDAPITARDSLVRMLCAPSVPGDRARARLVQIGPVEAQVIVDRASVRLVLVAWDDAAPDPYEALNERLVRLAASARIGATHVVLCGGPRDAQRLLERRHGARWRDRRISTHQLGLDGAIWDAGEPLRVLHELVQERRAVAAAGVVARVLSAAETEAIRDAGRQREASDRAEEKAFRARRPLVAFGFIGAMATLFLLELRWGGADFAPTLWRLGALSRDAVTEGEPWRVLSAALLHQGPLHLLFNAWALLVLGTFLERQVGSARLVVLLVWSIVAAQLASLLGTGGTSVGASGAVLGCVGACAWLLVRRPDDLTPGLETALRRDVLQVGAIFLVASLLPGVDTRAHLGGLVAGIAAMPVLLVVRSDLSVRVASTIAVSAFAASVGLALERGKAWELVQAPHLERVVLDKEALGLDIPAGLARRREQDDDTERTYVFGDFRSDFAVLRVRVHDRDSIPPARRLETLRDDPVGRAVNGLVTAGAPQIDRVFDADTLYVEGVRRSGAQVRRWFTHRGGRLVEVEYETAPEASVGWAVIGDEIFTGLRDLPPR